VYDVAHKLLLCVLLLLLAQRTTNCPAAIMSAVIAVESAAFITTEMSVISGVCIGSTPREKFSCRAVQALSAVVAAG